MKEDSDNAFCCYRMREAIEKTKLIERKWCGNNGVYEDWIYTIKVENRSRYKKPNKLYLCFCLFCGKELE